MKLNRLDTAALPFAIGLKPLEACDMFLFDNEQKRFFDEKHALYADKFDQVVMAEPDTQSAQQEVLDLTIQNLTAFHGNRFRVEENQVHLTSIDRTVDLEARCPISKAALLVQDDLVLMRRSETGWRLAAASVCFPSSWNLTEKFGKSMQHIHQPVPISDQMHTRIDRIFDNLRMEIPVWRANWSIAPDGELRHDKSEIQRNIGLDRLKGKIHFRTEYQTLTKLKNSDDILFTIRIASRPIDGFASTADGVNVLRDLHNQFLSLTKAQKQYKGVENHADQFVDWLRQKGKLTDDQF